MNEKWARRYLEGNHLGELLNEGVNSGVKDYYFRLLPMIYEKDGIGAVVGYHLNVGINRIGRFLVSMVSSVFWYGGKKEEPIKFDYGGVSPEGRENFVRTLRLLRPKIAMADGDVGPLPSFLLENILEKKERFEREEKTAIGRTLNSFDNYWNAHLPQN